MVEYAERVVVDAVCVGVGMRASTLAVILAGASCHATLDSVFQRRRAMRCLGQGGSGPAGVLPGMAQTSANVTSQYEAASNI
jgi:hypothetical protein